MEAGIVAGQDQRAARHGQRTVAGDIASDVDRVAVMLWLLERPSISGLLNIGSGQARSWLDLAKATFAAANRDCAIEFIDMPAEIAAGYQNFTQADIGKLRALGYDRPMTSLEDGVGDYVSNYLARPDPYL
jgi:ADP-L-glycero-D-manno-heptose 6-epimerase